jgi:hypothetical protein
MTIRQTIENLFSESLREAEVTLPDSYPDHLVLLESGLDSLGFAVLVTRLELSLGYDPFSLMEEPVYPQTLGEFVDIYDRFKEYATP